MKKLGKRFYKEDDVDECDGGGAACGGDAGASTSGASTSAGDAGTTIANNGGDAAAEMAGTTVADVLGTCKPGEGYMGKDNFYIPARAKCPLHHWEIANGGSKRKKKGKYPYEKGMKVVVSMFEDEMLNEWDAWPISKLRDVDWDDIIADAKEKARETGKEVSLPSYERWEAA